MKIIGIEHIGIAVEDLNASTSFWRDILRIVRTHTERVETEGVNTTIYDTKYDGTTVILNTDYYFKPDNDAHQPNLKNYLRLSNYQL